MEDTVSLSWKTLTHTHTHNFMYSFRGFMHPSLRPSVCIWALIRHGFECDWKFFYNQMKDSHWEPPQHHPASQTCSLSISRGFCSGLPWGAYFSARQEDGSFVKPMGLGQKPWQDLILLLFPCPRLRNQLHQEGPARSQLSGGIFLSTWILRVLLKWAQV